jgi:hypothetical protein
MRFALACMVAAVFVSTATAATPFTFTLARAHGSGSIAIGATTERLHSRLWLQRTGGKGIARGSATISCHSRTKDAASGQDEVFRFRLAPDGRQSIWRYAGTHACEVSVLLHGTGILAVVLRGY